MPGDCLILHISSGHRAGSSGHQAGAILAEGRKSTTRSNNLVEHAFE